MLNRSKDYLLLKYFQSCTVKGIIMPNLSLYVLYFQATIKAFHYERTAVTVLSVEERCF